MTDLHTRAVIAWAARRKETEDAARTLAEERAATLAARVVRVLDLAPEEVRPLPSPYAAVAAVLALVEALRHAWHELEELGRKQSDIPPP
jgi:hypothetical protein